MKRFMLALGLVMAMTGRAALAHDIVAVAVSPDGATVQVAGDNRVLYTLDAESLAVTQRHYVPGQISWMRYSADGRMLYVLAKDRSFAAYDARKMKARFSVEDIRAADYAPAAGRLALLSRKFNDGALQILDAASGETVATVDLPDLAVAEVAISPDGARALVLTQSKRSDGEERAQPDSEMKGYDKYLFQQQHDGYVSWLVSVDLASGTHEVAETWYRAITPGQVRMLGGAAAFVHGASDSGLVAADGSARLMNLGDRFVSMARIGNDGRTIVLTNGREVRVHPLDEGVAGAPLRVVKPDAIPGPGEQVEAMDEAADGTLYIGTSAYRIWKLAPGATEVVAAPVY